MTAVPGRHDGAGAPSTPAPPGRLFWPAVACGWAVMAAGAWGLVAHADRTKPGESARFVLGAAVVHDLLLAPVVVLAGWGVAKVVPARARAPVQAALVVSAVVALFSLPFVRGYGRVATNPSILPRNYGAGLGMLLVGTWVTAAIVVAVRCRAGKPGGRRSGARSAHEPGAAARAGPGRPAP